MRISHEWLWRWREGKVRPLQGNAPHDRAGRPGVCDRCRSVCDDPFSATALPSLPSIPGRPEMRFLRHGRNLSVRCRVLVKPKPGLEPLPPASSSRPSQRTCREEHTLLIVQMSSGRLFLDRVARQHCPSPLHRQSDQTSTIVLYIIKLFV